MSGIEHRAQRAVEGETEIVGFVEQQRWMLTINGVINAGGGDAVCFQGTHTQRLNEIEQRGFAAAAHRTGQCQPRRHRKSLIDESVHDPQRYSDELVCGQFDVAPQEMVYEVERIVVATARGIVVPRGPRV